MLIHRLRDGDAYSEIAAELYARGYTYGGLLLNHPAKDPSKRTIVDTSFFTPSDLIVLTTRAPLDDDEEDRKVVKRSGNSLERKLFRSLRKGFKVCARPMIQLTKRLAVRLPEEFAERAEIQFIVYAGATYKRWRKHGRRHWGTPEQKNLTALYLLYVRHAWPDGPGLLTTFGMGGSESLLWAYLLRTKFPELLELDASKFVLAELETEEINLSPRDITLSFVDNWNVQILLNTPL